MKYVPLNDFVFIRESKLAETQGGIVLPDSARKCDGRGDVIAVGLDVKNVKKGDAVVFSRVINLGDGLFVAKAEDVLAVVEEE